MHSSIPNAISEDFLHFVWRYRNFASANLKTIDGLPVAILKPGEYNTNAGPDFLNAQILIKNTHWAGNVEIHIKTSDWLLHNHSTDPAYDNVIMHVVYEHDLPEPIPDGRPLLKLKGIIPRETISNYLALRGLHQVIPCENMIDRVNELTKSSWLDRMLAERLEFKSDAIQKILIFNKNDWAETAYQWTARNFGFKINADPFERLARNTPHKMLARHKNNLFQIEALLYGQAGFLNENFHDNYPITLKSEYEFLTSKYTLKPGRKADWRFLRLRPANFPTIRLSQFSALIYRSEHLFSKILEVNDIKTALEFFEVSASDYWKEHFLFDIASESQNNGVLGLESRYSLVINTVAPLIFCYGLIKKEQKYKDVAMELLEHCTKEINIITKALVKLGFPNENAYHSQALIHLKNEYCNRKNCLSCGIGAKVLGNES